MRVFALALAFLTAAVATDAAAQTIRYEAALGAVFETPPVASTAFGTAIVDANPSTGAITYTVQVAGMVGTMAHIHVGAAGVAGPIVVNLAGGPTVWTGAATLTPTSVGDLLAERLYVNVHSAAFPGGELRGQLIAPRVFDAHMNGAQETPPVATAAKGEMRLTLNPTTGVVTYAGTYGGMVTTAAHVHVGAVGVAGPIVYNVAFTPTTVGGTSPALTLSQRIDMLTNRHYVNLHSAAFPGGEIRGQVEPGPLWATGDGISLSRGGLVDFRLAAPPAVAGQVYALLGSLSGTAPGLPFGGVTIPLNYDFFFDLVLNQPALFHTGAVGLLDAQSKGNARIQLPPGLPPGAAGLTMHHAYVVVDLFGSGQPTFASNAWPLTLLP
jgi:hypothetical protein